MVCGEEGGGALLSVCSEVLAQWPVDRPFRLPLSFPAETPSLKLGATWPTTWSPWLAWKSRAQLPSTVGGRSLCPLPVTDPGLQGTLEFQD